MQSARREKEIYKVTLVGGIANLLLLLFKFVAGILGASAAMIADAVHSFSDFLTDVIVVVMVRISSRKEDADHHYGHGKFETLATVIIGVVLIVVALGIMKNGASAILNVVRGDVIPAPGLLALVAAMVSILIKELLYRYTVVKGGALQSPSMVANAWHHRSDAFSSMGTALGIGGAILLGEEWRVLDPVAAVVVSLFILKVAFRLSRAGLDELLEKSLPAEVETRMREIMLSVPEVLEPHHLRTRRIGSQCSVDVHIRMDGNMTLAESHAIATEVERKIKSEFGAETYVNIHMEPVK